MTPKLVELSTTIDTISTRYHHSAVNNISMLHGQITNERQSQMYKHLSNTTGLLTELLQDLAWIGTMSDDMGV
jgi:hypothetical protein